MALEGTLSDFSLPDIFQLISLQRKSGVLTLKSKDDIVTVFFKDGNILAADSQQERIEHRLGYYLIRGKLMSEEQLKRALELQKETLQRLGNILLSHSLVGKEDLQKTLQLVITQKIYKLFRWRDGEYHFDTDAPVEYKDDYFIPIPAQGILMEAVRMIDEWPLLERKIHTFEMIFRKTGKTAEIDKVEGKNLTADDLFGDNDDFSDIFSSSKSKKEDESLEEEEKRVFRFVDGKRAVKDIILDAQMTDFDVCHALVSLFDKGFIEPLERFKIDQKTQWIDSRKKIEMKFPLGKVLLPIMITLILISIVMMNFNSINLITPVQIVENKLTTEFKETLSIGRIRRLAYAVEQYYYIMQHYPSNLREVARENIIPTSFLYDPWGRQYFYTLTEKSFLIEGRDYKGAQNSLFRHEVRLIFY